MRTREVLMPGQNCDAESYGRLDEVLKGLKLNEKVEHLFIETDDEQNFVYVTLQVIEIWPFQVIHRQFMFFGDWFTPHVKNLKSKGFHSGDKFPNDLP